MEPRRTWLVEGPGSRPILDALVMLLSATRFFGVAEEQTLPAILAESRKREGT